MTHNELIVSQVNVHSMYTYQPNSSQSLDDKITNNQDIFIEEKKETYCATTIHTNFSLWNSIRTIQLLLRS